MLIRWMLLNTSHDGTTLSLLSAPSEDKLNDSTISPMLIPHSSLNVPSDISISLRNAAVLNFLSFAISDSSCSEDETTEEKLIIFSEGEGEEGEDEAGEIAGTEK